MANDPHWNNVVLAMHMDDAGLTDLKGHAVTLNGNAARSSTQIEQMSWCQKNPFTSSPATRR